MELVLEIDDPQHSSTTGTSSLWVTLEAAGDAMFSGTILLEYVKYLVQVIPVEEAMQKLEDQKRMLQEEGGLQEMLKKQARARPPGEPPPLPNHLLEAYPDALTMDEYAEQMQEKIDPLELFDRKKFLEATQSIKELPPALIVSRTVANQALPLSIMEGRTRLKVVRRFHEAVAPWDAVSVRFVDTAGQLQGEVVHALLQG